MQEYQNLKDRMMEAYERGDDIMYRVLISGKTKYGGWRSYRKRSAEKCIPWPWDMVGASGIQGIEYILRSEMEMRVSWQK